MINTLSPYSLRTSWCIPVVRKPSPSDDEVLQAAVAALIGHFRAPIEQEMCAVEPEAVSPAELPLAIIEIVS